MEKLMGFPAGVYLLPISLAKAEKPSTLCLVQEDEEIGDVAIAVFIERQAKFRHGGGDEFLDGGKGENLGRRHLAFTRIQLLLVCNEFFDCRRRDVQAEADKLVSGIKFGFHGYYSVGCGERPCIGQGFDWMQGVVPFGFIGDNRGGDVQAR